MDRVVHRLVLESEAMEMDAAEFRQLAAEAIAQAVRAQTSEPIRVDAIEYAGAVLSDHGLRVVIGAQEFLLPIVHATAPDTTSKENDVSEMENMSENDYAAFLTNVLEEHADENDEEPPHITTFERAGLLTSSTGLVVRYGDAEFQLTIVRRP